MYLTKPHNGNKRKWQAIIFTNSVAVTLNKIISNLLSQQIIRKRSFIMESEFIPNNSRMVQIFASIMETYHINNMKMKNT